MLSADIQIRPALPNDVSSFKELRLKALRDHPDTFGMDYDDAALRDDEYWSNALKFDRNEKELFFAITNDSHLAGMTGIYRNASKKSRHAATIWGVYVTPDLRGNRIAERLVRACLDWAVECRIEIVRLAVVTGNLPALHCYQRCGFKVYGTEAKAILHNGVYYDEHLMSIDLV